MTAARSAAAVEVGLDASTLRDALPFHIAVDRRMRIIQLGRLLKRAVPAAVPGSAFTRHFTITHPSAAANFDALSTLTGSAVAIEVNGKALRLKGEIARSGDSALLLLCSPTFASAADVRAAGISLADFPQHDPSPELLFLVDAQRSAASEVEAVNRRLVHQRAELRDANRQLSAQFVISRSLASAFSVEQAASTVLSTLCAEGELHFAALYRLDTRSHMLECCGSWHDLDLDAGDVAHVVEPYPVAAASSAMLWRSRHTRRLPLERLTGERAPAGEAARRLGFTSLLSHSLRSGPDLTGILEFYVRPEDRVRDGLDRLLQSIEGHLGQFLAHRHIGEMLSDSREKYRLLFDTNPQPIWVYDRETLRFLAVNDTAVQKYGYSRKQFMDLAAPDIVDPVALASRPAAEPDEFGTGVWRHVSKTGGRFWVEVGSHVLEYNGRDARIVFGNDITERREALEIAERARATEVAIAAAIQQTLLAPVPPSGVPGLDFATRSIASQGIDGDYTDVFHLSRTCVDVVVGDVMGKGVPAAMLGAASKTEFQRSLGGLALLLQEHGRRPDPVEIVTSVHRVITPELLRLQSFLTLCYVRFDLDAMQATVVSCGHPHPIAVSGADGSVREIEGLNLPLGILADEEYFQTTLPIQSGDLFVLYSDGVTEATGPRGALFGRERLLRVVNRVAHRGAQDVVDTVCNEVLRFTRSAKLADDATCVAVRIRDVQAPPPTHRATLEIEANVSEIARARQFVANFCRRALGRMGRRADLDAFVLAVNEAVVNVIKHAGRAEDRRVSLEASASGRTVTVDIYDWGMRFDIEAVAEPPFDDTSESGYGVYIMRQTCDKVDFSQDELGRNRLSLAKHFSPDATRETPA